MNLGKKRSKRPLPKKTERPILAYYNVSSAIYVTYDSPDDRAYIMWPSGRVSTMDLWFGDKFSGGPDLVINNPGKGYAMVREYMLRREEGDWKLLHWEYL